MVKQFLKRVVGVLPDAAQLQLRERYWQLKSRFLYQTLYRMLHLEHMLDSGLTVKVASRGEWWIYNDIFVNGEYDVPIQSALQASDGKPLVVLDLGANVGYFAFRVVDRIRRRHFENMQLDVTMVEGSPQTFAELESRIQSQSMTPALVRTVHGLVGDRSGSASIRESPVHVKSGIVNIPAGSGVNVSFVDLETLMREKDQIDLLKCDIEGAELMFLENYRDLLSKVKSAVFELHHDQCDTGKCVSILQGLGFQETVLRANPSFSVCFFTRN